MKKAFILLLMLIPFIGAKANDGVYYTSGNQLIPITETEISVQKEVLDITRQDQMIHVHVYYEFFNPGDYYETDKPSYFLRWQLEFKF